MQDLVFGPRDGLMPAIQAVGGTGALRLGCELLRAAGAKRVLLPTPSWPNHPPILQPRASNTWTCRSSISPRSGSIWIDSFQRWNLSPGDAVMLQACCHNPLGADFTLDQWDVIADVLQKRSLIAFLDLAYQGFGDGVDEDVTPLRRVMSKVSEAIVTISGSKTFGVYKERVGAVFVQCPPAAREAVLTNIFHITRRALFDAAGSRRVAACAFF